MNDDRRAVGGLVAFVAILLGWVLTGAGSPARPAYAASEPAAQVTGGEEPRSTCRAAPRATGPGGRRAPRMVRPSSASGPRGGLHVATGRMPLPEPAHPWSGAIRSSAMSRSARWSVCRSLGGGPEILAVQVTERTCRWAATCSSHHARRATVREGRRSGRWWLRGAGGLGIDPVTVGEAIRTGPGVMPVLGAGQVGDEDLDAIAAYLVYLRGTRGRPAAWRSAGPDHSSKAMSPGCGHRPVASRGSPDRAEGPFVTDRERWIERPWRPHSASRS